LFEELLTGELFPIQVAHDLMTMMVIHPPKFSVIGDSVDDTKRQDLLNKDQRSLSEYNNNI